MVSKMMKLPFVLSLVLALGGVGYAQNGWWQRGDRDHDAWRWQQQDRDHDRDNDRRHDRDDNRWYKEGLREGRDDREHNRRFHTRDHNLKDRDDRDAYARGYREGYGQGSYGRGDRDRDRDGRYGNGAYGNRYPGGSQNNQAYNTGYQDGLSLGQKDRTTGHSYRPTEHAAYKDADHGQSVSNIDKETYKNSYRQGYEAGYQRGYGR